MNKIKKAKTDTLPLPSTTEELNGRPEAKNLLGIYSSLNDLSLEKSVKQFEGKIFQNSRKVFHKF